MSDHSPNPAEFIMAESVEADDLSELVSNGTGSYDDDDGINSEPETEDDTEEGEDSSQEEDTAEDTDEDTEEDTDDEEDEDEDDGAEDAPEDVEVRNTVRNLQDEADSVADLLGKSGINYNELVEEYNTNNGVLSPKTIVALENAGFKQTLVDAFIQGQQARYDMYVQRVFEIAGGNKEYAKLMKWAGKNLSPAEQSRFDKAVESNDIDEARFAVQGLVARYKNSVGSAPKLIGGKTPQIKGVKPFNSLEDMAAAMEDERFERDAAYTRQIERRMLASSNL